MLGCFMKLKTKKSVYEEKKIEFTEKIDVGQNSMRTIEYVFLSHPQELLRGFVNHKIIF